MFLYTFVILFGVLFSAEYIDATIFCPGDALESLIKCLLKTNIQPILEVDGLELNTFYHRLGCAKQTSCTPSFWQIWDKELKIMKNFDECMTRIPILKYTWFRITYTLVMFMLTSS